MTITQTPALKVGLLGDHSDPAAQIMYDVVGLTNADFIWVPDPETDCVSLDLLIVLHQDYALAHFATLLSSKIPCRILIRRSARTQENTRWKGGLAWLSGMLRDVETTQFDLVSLSTDAAGLAAATMGCTVNVLSPLVPVAPGPVNASVSRIDDLIEIDHPDDGTRRAQLSLFNWTRLRRLAKLHAKDAEDEDLQDLVAALSHDPPSDEVLAKTDRQTTLLAVVPNGVGLGHITRMMTIAFALREEYGTRVIFWCFSRAAEIVQGAGFEVILRQTASHLEAHPPDWRTMETLEFANAIRHLRPNAISYDGMTFDPFMVAALKQPGCGGVGVIWVRRGMLHPDADAQMLESEQFCDIVLEPGDLSVENDKGPTRVRQAQNRGFSERHTAPPVTLKPYLPAYTVKDARKRLSLPRRANCLVSLGGAFGNWDQIRSFITDYGKRHRVNLVWAQSPLAVASNADLGKTMVRRFYPLSRYLAAFDGMITATGYNSFHELMLGYDRPVLLAPTNHERLDDQVARASHAADMGWVSMLHPNRPEGFEVIIDEFLQSVRRRDVIKNRPNVEHGGPYMARAIHQVCVRYS